MKFKEFNNPEEKDYDINSSLESVSNNVSVNPYSKQLFELIGMLEDVDEKELQEQYGISMAEYYNPTAITINKVSEKLNEMHR